MYEKVLVPLDGSPLAESVLPHAVSVARGCRTPEVWLLGAIEPLPIREEMTESLIKAHQQRRSEALRYLEGVSRKLAQEGVTARYEVVEGEAGEAILQFAERNGADLIIMATHGRSGINRWVFGSVADKVLRAAQVPVFLVRAPALAATSIPEPSLVDMGHYEVLSDARTDQCSIRLLRVSPGRSVNPHYHRHTTQIYVVLQGTATARVKGRARLLRLYDTLRIPPGVSHAMETDKEALLLSISVPPLQPEDQYPAER